MSGDTKGKVDYYIELVEKRWSDIGACQSCGYHASFHEYLIDDYDIENAIEHNNGRLELSCLSDGGDDHRGVRISLEELKP